MRFPFIGKQSKKSQELVFTPTFFPLDFLNQFISNGLDANQQKFLELYLTVPELQAIINYKARVFAGMQVKAVNKDGEEKEIPQLQLFAKPNPLQNFKEFAQQYYVLRAIFGNEFMHPVFGKDKTNVQAMWNLPVINAEVIPVEGGIPFNMTEVEEIIKGYKFKYNSTEIFYDAGEIIHFNDNQVQFDRNKILLGDSKIRPLIQVCDNIKNAYEARGIIIHNSALGILSNKTTDGQGTVVADPKEKEKLQTEFKEKYGLNKRKWQVIMSNMNLEWQAMTIDTGKLKLFEEIEDDFIAIAGAHNFPPEILQSKKGSSLNTASKDEALKQLYQEAIIPEADEWLQGIGNWMGLDFTLKSDFSHIAVLQADLELRSKALNWASTGLDKGIQGGFIELPDAQEEIKKYML